MTVNIEDAKDLVKISSETNRAFMVNNSANWRKQSIKTQELVSSGSIGEIRHASIVFHAALQSLFNDKKNIGWNEPTGEMLGNGFGWGQLSHPLAWFFMVSGLTPSKVFTFNGKSQFTQADMFNACSILCTNGATVS